MLGALMPAELAPAALRLARGGDGRVHVLAAALRDLGERVRRTRIDHVEGCARLRPGAVDEVSELRAVLLEPGARLGVALRRRAMLHRLVDLGNAGNRVPAGEWEVGSARSTASDGGGPPQNGP